MTPEQFANLMEPKLRKVFFEAYKEIPEQFSTVFNVNKSNKRKETDAHFASLGMWDEFTGAVDYEDYEVGKEVEYTHVTYAKGTQVPLELVEDDLYGVIGENGMGTKRSKALARGIRARAETKSAEVFENSFSVNGYDGVPLFSDAHPLIGGGTQGNKITRVLSELGLKEARLLLRSQVDDKGIKIQSMGDTLIVPADLEYTALEVTETDRTPYSDENTKNIVGPRIRKVIVLDYLEDKDAWFLSDSTMNELNFFWRVKPEFKRDEDIDHFTIKFVGRARFSVGYSNYRGIVGSTGQTAVPSL